MAGWLAGHPQVFFSPTKEPNYFSYDFGERSYNTLANYERLFQDASDAHNYVGEASTFYLFSRTAVPAILEYAENPKFLVMVRNPVEMAYSLHEQTFFNGDEDQPDFDKAWELQSSRSYGAYLPKACIDPQILLYGRLCSLGEQLQRLFQNVPREKVHVVNLEYIGKDARREYQAVLEFLKLPDDGRMDFSVVNSAKVRNHPLLWKFIRRSNRVFRAAGFPHIKIGITAFFSEHDRSERPRPALGDDMRLRLYRYFRDDIKLLEELTGWDLSSWKVEYIKSDSTS